MTEFDAITFCRKHLAEHFNLKLLIDVQPDGRHAGKMHGHNEAADAYNALAVRHAEIEKQRSRKTSKKP